MEYGVDNTNACACWLKCLLRTSVLERDLLGFHHPPLSRGQVGLSHRNCREKVLVDQRNQASLGSKPLGKASKGCMRGLPKTPSAMTLRAGWTSSTSWTLAHVLPSSGCPVVVMVQSTHDRNGNHFAPYILRGRNRSAPLRDLLRYPLVRSCLVEIRDIRNEDALKLPLMQNQQVIETFLPHTSQELLTDSIGSRRVIGRLENLDVTCPHYTSKARPELAIVI